MDYPDVAKDADVSFHCILYLILVESVVVVDLRIFNIEFECLTLTGLEGHICPSPVRDWKAYMSHYCNIVVPSLWHHSEHHEVGGAKKKITLCHHELFKCGE